MILPVLLLSMVGCMDKKDRMNVTGPSINNPTTLTKKDVQESIGEVVDVVRKQGDISNNAIQQNMQSLIGVSVGKVSDDLVKLQAQFKSLADINAKLQMDVNASVASGNDLRLMLKNQMEFNAKLVTSLQLNADIQAKIDALGAAQVGLNNKIDQQTNELHQQLSAGHDLTNTNTQFTKEMLDALRSANQTTTDSSRQWAWVLTGIVSAISGIGMAYMHSLRKSAENRAAESSKKIERALCIMTGQADPQN